MSKHIAILLFIIAVVLDAITTHRALQEGRKEANPILARVLGARPTLFKALLYRAVIVTLMVLFIPAPWWGWAILAGIFYTVAARNAGWV